MGMDGQYVRVTPAELSRAIEDPDWAMDLVEGIQDTEEETEPPPTKARYLTTHKAWQSIAFLLDRAGFPVDIVNGEQPFADDVDWGYGPPRYLTAEQVQSAAQALAATTFDQLTDGVSRADLATAQVYPQIWDEVDSLDWIRGCYEPLAQFFTTAARHDNGMLIWLS